MAFAEEVGAYRFRLFGPRYPPGEDRRFRVPRPDGSSAVVLESRQLVLETNNVDLGAVEADVKSPLRELAAIPKASTLACGAVVNAAVRHMPEDLAFVAVGVGDGFLFLAGMLGNDDRTCVGIADFGDQPEARDALRARFDTRRGRLHSLLEGDRRDLLAAVPAPVGVFLCDAERSRTWPEELRAAERFLAEECVLIVAGTNRETKRRAVLELLRESGRAWRVVLDERTPGDHPTLGNGLLVAQAGDGAPKRPVEPETETGLQEPVAVPAGDGSHPPRVTVLHYRNPWVGIQDYPNLEAIGLNPGNGVREAFERSTGDYVTVLDSDVVLSGDAIGEAVRRAEGAARGTPRRARGRHAESGESHPPVSQAQYSPVWDRAFDERDEPQTVTVARALSVDRHNLVSLDLDLHIEDPGREVAVRFDRGLRLEGPAARCSRVPDGIVAGRVGAVLTPDRGWLVESVGSVGRAWPDLPLDPDGRVALPEPPRESGERVATIACELRRAWWTENFGHWTLDVLTRAATLLRAGAPDDVKLLVPAPVLPFHRETLAGLGFAEERILPWDGTPTRFRAVYVPTARPSGAFVFPAAVELLRELGGSVRAAPPARRLFVSRRQSDRSARIDNQDELLVAAQEHGFVEVRPEMLPFAEQVRLFAEAEIVAGPHGSGLVNTVYMARGTGLCELAPARLHAGKVPNFWNLAACGRQRYSVCVGDGKRVDPKRFRRVLRDLILFAKRERSPAEPAITSEVQNA